MVDKDCHRRRRRITLRLSARPDGRFAKVIDGQYLYFGKDGDRDLALRELADHLRRREGGIRAPLIKGSATVTAVAVVFALDRNDRFVAGKLTRGALDDYKTAVQEFADVVGGGVLVDDLAPEHFKRIRDAWAARLGPWALDRCVQSVRTMFNWSLTHRLIPREPFYGDAFHKSTAAEKRRAQRDTEGRRGERKFTRGELAKMLGGLVGPLRAFVLLGLNCGMYSKDVSDLRRQDLKREGRLWLIDSWREKTWIRRRAPLWPETVKAIEAVPARKARVTADADRMFLTIHGRPWNRGNTDAVAQEFRKRLDALGIGRDGVSFGALRHTHTSAVGDHPDKVAARWVRGHKVASIEGHYDFPSLPRLRDVTELARQRLLPAAAPARRTDRKKKPAAPRRRRPAPAATPAAA